MITSRPAPVLVVGVGNIDRGDDAIGRIIARAIMRSALPGVKVIEQGGDGAELIDSWTGADAVIVIDAADCRGKPGTIHRFDAAAAPIPFRTFRHSTHAFGVAEAIEVGRALGQLPRRLIVFGIVGKDFTLGRAVTPQLDEAADRAVRRILRELQDLRTAAGAEV